jgi:membrane-bound lytic murein transglycosylase D
LILRILPYLLLVSAVFSGGGAGAMAEWEAETLATRIMNLTEEEVERRLSEFDDSLLDYRMDEFVYRRIVNYLRHWPISSGRMIARSARFYPIFAEEIAAARMPAALKHLSIVESALRSWAISPVGAGGLWQLMPETARELGLTVTDVLDERLDPTLGCAAGLEYLRIQYERYGDWALALAAYNSGPGNVNRAIRRSGSRDYWRLRRFLPRETRHYVPSFIAAVYLMSYHHDYGLPATELPLDQQLTERIRVHRKLSLHRVAQVTGLRPGVVIEMNPQYLRGYLPGRRGGHTLLLPKRVVPALKTYLARHPADRREDATHLPWAHPLVADGELDPDRYYEAYTVSPGPSDSTTAQVARTNGVVHDRMLVWSNRGERDTVRREEQFTYHRVIAYQPYDRRTRDIPEPAIPLALARPRQIPVPEEAFLAYLPSVEPVRDQQRADWWDKLMRGFRPLRD